jgi:MYXO-CTERM domain-containing protein
MALLDSARHDFARENPVLNLAAGALSLARKLDRFLPEAPEPSPSSIAAPPGGGAFLFAVLGVIALRRRLLGLLTELEAARDAARNGAGAPRPERRPPAPDGLLR